MLLQIEKSLKKLIRKSIKMKIITAIQNYQQKENQILCFLAGGITNCHEWQVEIIENLKNIDNLVIFNPRRKNFPINNPNASLQQIKWQFYWLEQSDIFSMYFDDSVSDQPICFYELGRNIERMKQKFPNDWNNRIIISCNSNFKRYNDVIIQTELATNGIIKVNSSDLFDELNKIHSQKIIKSKNYIENIQNNLFQ